MERPANIEEADLIRVWILRRGRGRLRALGLTPGSRPVRRGFPAIFAPPSRFTIAFEMR